jgi:hypothetical protein
VEPRAGVGRFGETKNLLPLPGFELRTAQPLAVVTIIGVPAGMRTVGFLDTCQKCYQLIHLVREISRAESRVK